MKTAKMCQVVCGCVLMLATGAAQAALVSHWKLDDGPPATTASDSVGTNPAAFASGGNSPSWSVPGMLGPYALAFNGSQWASAPDSPSLDVSTGITLSAWVKRGRTGTRELFLGKGDGALWSSTSYWLEFDSGNRAAFYLGSPTADHRLVTSATISDTTQWHHLLGTWDGQTQRLYVDGVLQTATLTWTGTITNSSSPFMLGRINYGSLWFSGQIDDVGLWDSGLSEGKAKAVYYLAVDPLLRLDLGGADRLFQLYDAGSGGSPQVFAGLTWKYATGLGSYPLGIPTRDAAGNVFLRLDNLGAGVAGMVPEPESFLLLGVGGLASWMGLFWRRRRRGSVPS